MESGDDEVAKQLIYDYREAALDPPDRLLCEYAEKLTLTPGAMNGEDTAKLRSAGFTDEQITIAAQVIGYFNYINRIADGLGVELEDWMTIPIETWHPICFHPRIAQSPVQTKMFDSKVPCLVFPQQNLREASKWLHHRPPVPAQKKLQDFLDHRSNMTSSNGEEEGDSLVQNFRPMY